MKEYQRKPAPEIEYRRSADILKERFIQRSDVYARQLSDGRYISVKEPLLDRQVVGHLRGKLTLGVYVLDEKNRATFTVLDADNDAAFRQIFRMGNSLRQKGIPSYMESSRRGGHLWFFYESAVPGKIAKRFGEAVLQEAHIGGIEVFPKQEVLATGPGSLIRLPLGRHQKSGKVYPFVDASGRLLAPTIREQLAILSRAETVSTSHAVAYAETIPDGPQPANTSITELPVWEKIKRVAPALEFIGQYVELEPTASGGIGHCPFHDDNHKSFGVNEEGNYWHCFAGCGGGSVIDFYMKWHDVDFSAAVRELSQQLGVIDNGSN